MLEKYLTIKNEGQHEIEIEKSRFICTIARAETEQAAQSFISSIKKKYRDATHNCSAYIIGENDQHQKANDDGEPSGTAGIPMLEVLKKKNLKNTVVIVTRYFGGTKLGAGGLVRAYGKAVSETCKAIGIVERTLATIISVPVPYNQLDKLENLLLQKDYQIAHKTYTDLVTLDIFVDQDDIDPFTKLMTEFSSGKIHCQKGIQQYREKDVPEL
ncbi:YigZ family protein [Listeria costaricensis]|uniref:YigZ family protein n=1 Tax=Listeria costaricensis TaxID=2026604 RepID=UPI000C0692AF|nr:YigZ family protein [Listeria costaricensis]